MTRPPPSAAPSTTPSAASDSRRERTALVVSLVASSVLGTGAVVWGVAASADVLVFDGIFSLAGILLVGISLTASRASGKAPSPAYPFGRNAATPLAVAMQGAFLAATLVYGTVNGIMTILSGGSSVSEGTLVVYGVVSTAYSYVVAWWIVRHAPGTALAEAEAVAWRAGGALSVVVVVGGLAGLLLVHLGHEDVARYMDPTLVLVAVVLIAPMAVRLVRESMHELLEGAPPPDVEAAVRQAVEAARDRFDLPEPAVRATKLGRRLYVEVDFVVPEHRWEVDDEDEVRRVITAPLRALPLDAWVTVELTTDPGLLL